MLFAFKESDIYILGLYDFLCRCNANAINNMVTVRFNEQLDAVRSSASKQFTHLRLSLRMQMCLGVFNDYDITRTGSEQSGQNWQYVRNPKPNILRLELLISIRNGLDVTRTATNFNLLTRDFRAR